MTKNPKMRLLLAESLVGLFMIAIVVALGMFTVVLSRDSIFKKRYAMSVQFEHVLGLRDGDNVVVKGMPVGKVHSLVLEPHGVRVRLLLEQDLQLRPDYAIAIRPTSVLGGRQVEVDTGTDAGGALLARETLFSGQPPFDMFKEGERLFEVFSNALEKDGIVDDMKKSANNLRELSDRLVAGQGTLARLMSEDDTVYNDLAASVASVRTITSRLEGGQGAIGKLLSADDPLYADLSATVASMKRITAGVERGDGTLGKILSDDLLYTNVLGLVGEVRATVDDFRETIPITTFSSIFFGAF